MLDASLYAQSFITPMLSDQFLSNVTTSILGTPNTGADDVTINCDMLNDGGGNAIKAIAWDEGSRSDAGHLYFEDGQGNDVFLQFRGVHPDIVLGHSDNLGDYRAAVVYIVRVNTNTSYAMIDFYDLTGLGTTGFTATYANTVQLSSNLGIIYDTDPVPHIDMWSDDVAGTQINGLPGMREFAVTWNEASGEPYYNWGRIATGTININPPGFPKGDLVTPAFTTFRGFNDVACYTDVSPTNPLAPQRIAAITYGEGGNTVVVQELDFTTASPTATQIIPRTTYSTSYPYFPRIEAMSQHDGTLQTKWQTVVTHLGSCWEYNNTSTTGSDITTTLLAGGRFMSTAIAAGIGAVGAEPTNIGNIQYTPGYFEWWGTTPTLPLTQTINYYARAVDAATGSVTDPDYYVINTNPVTGQPNYGLADASKSLALSNCSNSGDYLLSVWYDDANAGASGATGDIWYKFTGNTIPMQFKMGKVGTVNGARTVYPNPAIDKVYLNNAFGSYSIYSITGIKIVTGEFSEQSSIDISSLSSGIYLLQTDSKTFKFTKQ